MPSVALLPLDVFERKVGPDWVRLTHREDPAVLASIHPEVWIGSNGNRILQQFFERGTWPQYITVAQRWPTLDLWIAGPPSSQWDGVPSNFGEMLLAALDAKDVQAQIDYRNTHAWPSFALPGLSPHLIGYDPAKPGAVSYTAQYQAGPAGTAPMPNPLLKYAPAAVQPKACTCICHEDHQEPCYRCEAQHQAPAKEEDAMDYLARLLANEPDP